MFGRTSDKKRLTLKPLSWSEKCFKYRLFRGLAQDAVDAVEQFNNIKIKTTGQSFLPLEKKNQARQLLMSCAEEFGIVNPSLGLVETLLESAVFASAFSRETDADITGEIDLSGEAQDT